MAVKLKCAATGDLLMVSDVAETLLGLLGKRADQPGIIEPQEMPQALQTLQSLQDKSDAKPERTDAAQDEAATPSFSDEQVSLRQRAWPLIQMIERAQSANKPIVWGV